MHLSVRDRQGDTPGISRLRGLTVGLAAVPLILATAAAPADAAKPPKHPGSCTTSKGLTTCTVINQQQHLVDSFDDAGNYLGQDTSQFVLDWCTAYFGPDQGGRPYYGADAVSYEHLDPAGQPTTGALSFTMTTVTTTVYRGSKTVSQSTRGPQAGYTVVDSNSLPDCYFYAYPEPQPR